jgi:predicted transcriptional regulator
MQEVSERASPDYIGLTSDIVSAYVANNSVAREELRSLIGAVHEALARTSKPPAAAREALVPPVPIKSTVRPDYIISLEDGRRYKSMRRHLAARGLTPEQYRQKWGLRPDYPMVAANYSKARSELAKAFGLGQARKGRSAKASAKRAGKG